MNNSISSYSWHDNDDNVDGDDKRYYNYDDNYMYDSYGDDHNNNGQDENCLSIMFKTWTAVFYQV